MHHHDIVHSDSGPNRRPTRRKRRAARALVVGLLAAGPVVFVAGPAAADERTGTKVSGPGTSCDTAAENDHVKVCFEPDGDKLFVKDKAKDGRSALGLFDDSDQCRNPYGVGTWVVCDYEKPEGVRLQFMGYTRDFGDWPNPNHDLTGYAYDWNINGTD